MRKMWIGMMALMVLCGCSKSGKTEVSISSDMLLEKIEEKETFVVVINQTSSQAGMNFRRTFVPFMREHEKLPIYEIMLDEQGTKKQDASMAMSKLVNEVTEFDGNIPAMLYYKDGEVSKQTSGALSEIAWTNFLKECDIMKGEKEEESQYKMAESEQFQTDLQQLYQDWKQGNEMYLFVGENDKYSMMFSETLKKTSEELEKTIYHLNLNESAIYENEEIQELMQSVSIHMTPSLLHIKEQEVKNRIEDNVNEEELNSWFAQR